MNTSINLSWLIIGFVTRVTRRVPVVEHELLTSSVHLCFLWDLWFSIFVFCVVVFLFVFLSPFTASGYHFSIFKLLLSWFLFGYTHDRIVVPVLIYNRVVVPVLMYYRVVVLFWYITELSFLFKYIEESWFLFGYIVIFTYIYANY